MTVDAAVKLINAIALLIQSVAWPTVALLMLWWFGGAIRNFIGGVSEGSIKGFGIEATARRAATEAIVRAETKGSSADAATFALKGGIGKTTRLADFIASSFRFGQLSGSLVIFLSGAGEIAASWLSRSLIRLVVAS